MSNNDIQVLAIMAAVALLPALAWLERRRDRVQRDERPWELRPPDVETPPGDASAESERREDGR